MPITDKRPLKVFLSYASQDKLLVRELSRRLVGEGWIDTWQDEKNLLPGQDWRVKIEEAVEDADVVIIVLSQHSVSKEGHVQKELRYAREIALEKPEDAIFLIPLRLDECEVPRGLRFYQWVDYFGDNKDSSYKALVASLKLRYEQKIKSEEAERLRKEQQEREIAERVAREKAEKSRLEAEELVKQKAAKEERESAEFAERERKAKELRNKQARESREKEKRKTEKKEEKFATVKPKASGQIVYWFGGLFVLIFGIIFLSSLNNPSSTPQPTPEATYDSILLNATHTETIEGGSILTPASNLATISPSPTIAETPNIKSEPISISNIDKLINLFTIDYDSAADVIWSPDSKSIILFVSRSFDRASSSWLFPRFELYDVNLRSKINSFETDSELRWGSFVISPNGELLAFYDDGAIHVWQKSSGRLLYVLNDPEAWRLVFSPDSMILASASHDQRRVSLWNMEDGEAILILDNFYLPIGGLAYSPDGKILAVAVDNQLHLLNSEDGSLIRILENAPSVLVCVKFSPNGKYLITLSNSGELKLLTVDDARIVKSATDTDGGCNSVSFSSDNNFLAYGSGRVVRLWDLVNGDEKEFIGHEVSVYSVNISNDGSVLISAGGGTNSSSSLINFWDVNKGSIITSVPGRNPLISPDGSALLIESVFSFENKVSVFGIDQ